jgi:hypothetical protein
MLCLGYYSIFQRDLINQITEATAEMHGVEATIYKWTCLLYARNQSINNHTVSKNLKWGPEFSTGKSVVTKAV